MTNEVTVPLLPCASIDDIVTFYDVLGVSTMYTQRKPNPYVALQRQDLRLHFFEIAEFDPEQSHGSCLVLTSDLEGLHRAFAPACAAISQAQRLGARLAVTVEGCVGIGAAVVPTPALGMQRGDRPRVGGCGLPIPDVHCIRRGGRADV